jgi:hypothetical protein
VVVAEAFNNDIEAVILSFSTQKKKNAKAVNSSI